jgi:CBS domain-containing protein
MRVRDKMTQDPVSITPQTTIADALALMREGDFRRLPWSTPKRGFRKYGKGISPAGNRCKQGAAFCGRNLLFRSRQYRRLLGIPGSTEYTPQPGDENG